ncbi:MAG: 50S ribosomal protein L23 [bacterium]
MDFYDIIIKPIYTERGTLLKEKENRYTFKVNPSANKTQIKEAVEKLFKVSVLRVNTARVLGKKRRMGSHEGYKSEWKKALVKIKKGQEIKPIEA